MNKYHVLTLLIVVPIVVFAAFLLSPFANKYSSYSIYEELKSGQPFIKVFTVTEPPLQINVGHGNLGQGELWLVKVGSSSEYATHETVTYAATITNNNPFIGEFSFKNSEYIYETGTYYFKFISTESINYNETKSNVFEIKSSAPFIKSVNIEPNTIRKGASAVITWNTENVKSCTVSSLNLKTNEITEVKNSLPSTGSLNVNPQETMQYAVRCNSTEEFKKEYTSAINTADGTVQLFVE
jgi:hypothetical protein